MGQVLQKQSDNFLLTLQQLYALSNELLLLAEDSEWEQLIEQGYDYLQFLEQVLQSYLQHNFIYPANDYKQLFQQIIINTNHIKKYLWTRKIQLQSLIHEERITRQVENAYTRFSE